MTRQAVSNACGECGSRNHSRKRCTPEGRLAHVRRLISYPPDWRLTEATAMPNGGWLAELRYP